ncbi:MAG TPA: HD domain-containing phosphohydrolase [Chthonomonadaceae bacterium]|nr:HD domain-containing phosphohydrolase [Chthonomonadaceae bacterium]
MALILIFIIASLAVLLLLLKRREAALQRRARKLSTLLEFGACFASGQDAAQIMEQTLRAAIRDTGATAGYIMLVNERGNALLTEMAVSMGKEHSFPRDRAWGEGMEGYVAETGKPLVLAREQEPRGQKSVAARSDLHYEGEAALCLPMLESGSTLLHGGVIGVFTLLHHRPGHRFLDEDVDLARMLAGLATMAFVNSRLYEDQQAAFLRSLQALAKTLDAKDPYTQGHSYRVSELCVMLGKKLGVAPEVLHDLRNGALLHDIGKIGIPDLILRKPGPLNAAEFEIMKQHPVIGYEICKPLGLGDEILRLIRNHHEKLDGTGYPDGLKLGELPLPLRIICVADAFDAMSSSRPYRKVLDSQLRNAQLNRFAGTQFDPVVVETLKGMVNSGELDELYKEHWRLQQEEDAEGDISLFEAA